QGHRAVVRRTAADPAHDTARRGGRGGHPARAGRGRDDDGLGARGAAVGAHHDHRGGAGRDVRPGGGLRRGVARQGHLTALGEAGLAAVEQRGRAPVAVDLGARGRGDRDGGAGGAHRDAGIGGGRGGQREGERGGGCRGRGG